jgi:Putative adhesin
MLLVVLPVVAIPISAAPQGGPFEWPSGSVRVTSNLSGSVRTRDGGRLHVFTPFGNVIIHTRNSGNVDYSVHLEADGNRAVATELLSQFHIYGRELPDGVSIKGVAGGQQCCGRLWVTLTLNIPKDYSLDVSTGGGNIQIDDIDGRVSLYTAGGNISAGNIGGPARLVSESGGHISVRDVAGNLTANTGGGHITTGMIEGNASLHTAGGHIHVTSVEGIARLETGGGNITLQHSGTELMADTAGGEIDVGEAAGLVRATTGGGGIRVVRLSGPTDLQTTDGSIYLTQVDSSVKATASAGGITAWFVGSPKAAGSCDLQSNDGDIVVYLPRMLPVTIDGQIQMGYDHRVIVDPAFPLKVSYDTTAKGQRMLRVEGSLNGGGEVIHLRTVAGNIRLALSDQAKQMQLYKEQMDELQRQMQMQFKTQFEMLEQWQKANDKPPQP